MALDHNIHGEHLRGPHQAMRHPLILAALTSLATTGLASPAGAFETTPDGDLMTETIAASEGRGASAEDALAGHEGFRAGNIFFDETLATTFTYDDNIFRSATEQRSDVRIQVLPSVTMQTRNSRHAANLTVAGKIVSLVENDDQNYADVGARFSGGLHIDHAHILSLSLQSELKHQEKGYAFTPNDAGSPVPIFHNRAAAGLTRDTGRLYGTASISADRFDYQDVKNIYGEPLDQDHRDTDLFTGQLRVGYRVSPALDIVGKLVALRQLNEGNSYSSSQSTGYEATVGVRFESSPMLRWRLMGGWGIRDFDREDMADVDSSLIEAGFEWLPTERMRVQGTAARSIDAQVLDDRSGGAVNTLFALSADYDVLHNLKASAGVSYNNIEFLSSDRVDTSYGAHVGLDYEWTKNWHLSLRYDYETREMDEDDQTMSRNRFTIGGRLQF